MRTYDSFNLLEFNAYRLNAICTKAWFPEIEDEFIEIFKQIPSSNKIVIGNGNNIILSKDYYEDEFVILNGSFNKIEVNGDEIVAEAGATMLELSEIALGHSLTGLEIFYDIPSSVGGAVFMNAGTNEIEIKDTIIKVRYLDLTNLQIREITNSEIGFEYRNSYFQRCANKIILKAWFKLSNGNHLEIKNKMEHLRQIRWEKQPREYPNCGSVFKRPSGHFVGPLIDNVGMKGFTVGGAKVSEKHCGFIINTGNASGCDIIAIIDEACTRVRATFGIELEVEQRIL